MTLSEEQVQRHQLIVRFNEIMRRHVHVDDKDKADDEFVRLVFKRYEHWRGVPLIDPNE